MRTEAITCEQLLAIANKLRQPMPPPPPFIHPDDVWTLPAPVFPTPTPAPIRKQALLAIRITAPASSADLPLGALTMGAPVAAIAHPHDQHRWYHDDCISPRPLLVVDGIPWRAAMDDVWAHRERTFKQDNNPLVNEHGRPWSDDFDTPRLRQLLPDAVANASSYIVIAMDGTPLISQFRPGDRHVAACLATRWHRAAYVRAMKATRLLGVARERAR